MVESGIASDKAKERRFVFLKPTSIQLTEIPCKMFLKKPVERTTVLMLNVLQCESVSVCLYVCVSLCAV